MLNFYSRKMKLSLCNKKKYKGHMYINLRSSYLDTKLMSNYSSFLAIKLLSNYMY